MPEKIPPLPQGYTEDESVPPLPEGYSVESPEVKKNISPNSKTGTPSTSLSPYISASESGADFGAMQQKGQQTKQENQAKYSTFQNYEQKQKRLSGVDKALNSSEIKFANTYVDPSEKQYLIDRKKQLEQERVVAKQDATANYGQTQKELDHTINTDIQKSGYEYFTRTNESGFKVVDTNKVDEYAKNLSVMAGMEDEGYFKDLVYNRMKAQVEYEISRPKIDKLFKAQYEKKYGNSPEKDIQEDFAKNFEAQKQVEAQLNLQAASVAAKVKQDAGVEFNQLQQVYEPQLQQLNGAYKTQSEALKENANALNQMYSSGQITQEQYNQQIQELQANESTINSEYLNQFNLVSTEYLKAQRELNGKYSSRYQRQVAELQSMASAKLRAEQEKYQAKYRVSPEIEKRYKETWAEATNQFVNSEEALKYGLDAMKPSAYLFGQSFVSGLGGAVKSISTSLGYDTGRIMGDYISSMYSLSSPEIKEASELLDLTKVIRSSGEMIGGMAPMMVTQAMTALATGGASIPVQMVLQGGIGFTMETAQMGGAMYDETFAKTGNVAESENAAKKVMQGNVYLLPLYAVDGLPFIEKATLGVKNTLLRGVVKGTVEATTELPQEFFQNAFEDLARNNEQISEVGKYMTIDRLENTALNILPSTFLMGAVPTYVSGTKNGWAALEAKSLAAKHDLSRLSDTALEQYVYDMRLRYGDNFAKAYLSGLYQSNKISDIQSQKLLKVVDTANTIIENAQRFKLSKGQSKVYASLLFGYENSMEEANEATDDIVKQALNQKATDMKKIASEYLVNGKADFGVIILANNEQYVATFSNVEEMLNDEDFADKIKSGDVKIVLQSKDKSEQFTNLAARIKGISDERTAEPTTTPANERAVEPNPPTVEATTGTGEEGISQKDVPLGETVTTYEQPKKYKAKDWIDNSEQIIKDNPDGYITLYHGSISEVNPNDEKGRLYFTPSIQTANEYIMAQGGNKEGEYGHIYSIKIPLKDLKMVNNIDDSQKFEQPVLSPSEEGYIRIDNPSKYKIDRVDDNEVIKRWDKNEVEVTTETPAKEKEVVEGTVEGVVEGVTHPTDTVEGLSKALEENPDVKYNLAKKRLWTDSGTKFEKPDEHGRIYFTAKNGERYQIIKTDYPNSTQINVEPVSYRGKEPLAHAEFKKNDDGTYSSSMASTTYSKVKGANLATAIYDLASRELGNIKPSKFGLTEDGIKFWDRNNKISEQYFKDKQSGKETELTKAVDKLFPKETKDSKEENVANVADPLSSVEATAKVLEDIKQKDINKFNQIVSGTENTFTGKDYFYHGTLSDFNTFKQTTKAGIEPEPTVQPIFLAQSKSSATPFTKAKGGRLLRVKLSKDANIFDTDNLTTDGKALKWDFSNINEAGLALADDIDDGKVELTLGKLKNKSAQEIFNEYLIYGDYDVIESKGIKNWLIEHGFDGAYVREFRRTKDKNLAIFNIDKLTINEPKSISEAYHKAKADGSNPELVSAVESLIGQDKGQSVPKEEKVPEPQIQKPIIAENEESANIGLDEKEAEKVSKKAGISPKNLKDLYRVNRELFGQNRVKALAGAVAMDRMVGAMAKRLGISKPSMYEKIKFEKGDEKILAQTPNVVFQGKLDGKPATFIVPQDAPEIINGFYSPIEKAVIEAKTSKWGDGKQAWGEISKMKGIKPDEVKWTGLEEWLTQQGKVTKQEILDYIKNNRVQLVEVVKGDGSNGETFKDYLKKVGVSISEYNKMNPPEQRAIESGFKNTAYDNTKFSQYQLEGDKSNYREILVTMPSRVKFADKWDFYKSKGYDKEAFDKLSDEKKQDLFIEFKAEDKKQRESSVADFKSSHFDEPNIIGHLRISNRVDAEGNKVLHISEVQSDWGQTGKKEGFAIDRTEKIKELENKLKQAWDKQKDEKDFLKRGEIYDNEIKPLASELAEVKGQNRNEDIPQAPFVTNTSNWTKLLLKYAIREAVKDGATKVTWESGETQNERYDLSKQVDMLNWKDNEDGTYSVIGQKDGTKVFEQFDIKKDKLSDYVGKEVAEKIVENSSTRGSGTIKGLDLKAGGSGMIGFYGSPTEGKEGIVGKTAKELVKELTGKEGKIGEAKIEVNQPEKRRGDINEYGIPFNADLLQEYIDTFPDEKGRLFLRKYDDNFDTKTYPPNDLKKDMRSIGYDVEFDGDVSRGFDLPILKISKGGQLIRLNDKILREKKDYYAAQHSVEITPELKAGVQKGMPLFQGAKGAMQAMADGTFVVYALTDPNISTPLHELAHVFEHYLTETEKNTVIKNAGTKGWTRETSEYFARGFEKYLSEGKSPISELNKVFAKFKEWLTEIYNGIKGSDIDIELNDEMRDIYAQMFGEETTSGGLTFEEKKNLRGIAKGTGVNFQEVRNVVNKYGVKKPLTEITEQDFKEAQETRGKVKSDTKIFEDILSDEVKAEEIAESAKNPKIKEILDNFEDIKKQLMDKVGLSEECKW